MGIAAMVVAGTGEWPAFTGRSDYEVSVRFHSSLPQRRMARLRNVVADAGRDRSPRRRHNPK